MNKHPILAYITTGLLLIITIIIALFVGASGFSMSTGLHALVTGHPATVLNTMLTIRLPRIVAALISGALLSVAGAFFQSALRNPIADPSILGISAGADLLMLLGGILFPAFFFTKLIFALIGGLIAFGILIIFQTKVNPYRLVLIGIAINAVLVSLKQIFTPTTGSSTSVSLSTITWSTTTILLVLGIIGLMIALIVAPLTNYLKIGDQQLKALGLAVNKVKTGLLLLGVYLTCFVTANVGVLPFLGIIVPHLSRSLVGNDYRQVIPFATIAGALLMLIADTIGRTVVIPSEIPAAALLTIIGGPYLIYILTQKGVQHEN
ncbi:iron ABC transporter permease protein [Paucilactobacillus hokkaidonensis JCM 18461]|uniref:Probable heme-iron transport system permease protein IsdF n=2 Tax=Paucilactobacillus hokkaidonensis TaxID=1193095 RepID=A0A0A1H0N2_9LACO|nr:iron ABC transporter permease [Paucilactobacillus hokkaidonensis]KRO10240.1 iron (Fe) ABC superfamily ATP binding cassette transporter, membrane protein [Paucilactobacillus hokkaidonensis]BAP86256.1 iron ABC transporter permease protein [Paucilactobacillus hokkaidonensis JCM 18461]